MLKAKDKYGKPCLAWLTEKDKKSFYCPDCGNKVILRKGKIREHHFAHKVKNNCSNYVGETVIHHKCKREIYTALQDYDYCSNYYVEKKVGKLRPDICFRIRNKPVVIEVQKSSINIDIITKRTEYYSKKGIQVLWIIPDEKYLKTRFNEKHERLFSYPKSWQTFLHQMYFGRIYIWKHGTFVKPIHLERFTYYVEEGNWVEESPEEFHNTHWYEEEHDFGYYGGYEKTSKTKFVSKLPQGLKNNSINIVTDFSYSPRDKWSYKNQWVIPKAKLLLDNLDKWW